MYEGPPESYRNVGAWGTGMMTDDIRALANDIIDDVNRQIWGSTTPDEERFKTKYRDMMRIYRWDEEDQCITVHQVPEEKVEAAWQFELYRDGVRLAQQAEREAAYHAREEAREAELAARRANPEYQALLSRRDELVEELYAIESLLAPEDQTNDDNDRW